MSAGGVNPKLVLTSLGPLLVGGVASSILYGVTCTQTFVYFQRSKEDRAFLKAFVTLLWILDTFDVVLSVHALFYYLVENYANPAALLSPTWSLLLHNIVTGVTNFLVRGMYTRKVWKLSQGNWILCGLILFLSCLDFGCSIATTAKVFGSAFEELRFVLPLIYTSFAAMFAADITVALSLCYFLHKIRTGIRQTDSVIDLLILYTINTGLVTAIDCVVGLIVFAVQHNLIYMVFYLLLSKLYINSYLANLNARERIREGTEDVVSLSLAQFSRSRNSYIAPSPPTTTPSHPADKQESTLSVMVSKQVENSVDDDKMNVESIRC